MTDIRELDRRALKTTQSIVDRVDARWLGRPTPCTEWTLAQLLAHMVGQNHGFAAVARGETSDLGVWADRPVGADPAAAFAASVADVTDAFAADGMLERELWLPEIRRGGRFPARQAVAFHFLDYVVHGWDVAVSIGAQAEFDADLLEAVLPMAEQVPGGVSRQREGAAFGPEVDGVEGESTLDRVLITLGRSPSWPN